MFKIKTCDPIEKTCFMFSAQGELLEQILPKLKAWVFSNFI